MSVTAVTIVILAAAVSVPLVAAVLVSVASRREDRDWTLAGPPPGPARTAARRIVAFHSEGMDWVTIAGVRRPGPAVPGYQRGPGHDLGDLPGAGSRPGEVAELSGADHAEREIIRNYAQRPARVP
jgi:hypothetical protein